MMNFSRLRKLVLVVVFVTLGLSASQSAEGGFKEGLDSYDRNDYATALKEWKPLVEQGDAGAQYYLGVMYANGQGVIQDNVYAHMWFNIAASSGDKEAVKNRDRVAKRMTPADISKSQDLARECVRKKYKGC